MTVRDLGSQAHPASGGSVTGIVGDQGLGAGLGQPLQPGDPRKVGPYWLLGPLGSGGMGRVYLRR